MKTTKNITRLSAEQVRTLVESGQDRTDWRRLDALTETEIEAAIDQDEEGHIDWLHGQTTVPRPKQQVTVRLDLDVIDFFKSQGRGYQTRMNEVLKRYVEANRR